MTTRTKSQQEEMVSSILKSLLESPDLSKIIKSAVKDAMASTLEQVMKSLEIQECRIHDLECKVDTSQIALQRLEDQNEEFRATINQLQTEINVLEQYTRRNSLRISGIPEKPGESTDQLVQELASEKLGVNLRPLDIDRSHRVGLPNSTGNRAIIVKFSTYNVRLQVISARKKLKSTGIVIYEDLTARNVSLLRSVSNHPKITRAWSLDGRIYGLVKSEDGKEYKKRFSGKSDILKL